MQVNEQNIKASARLCDAIKWHPCLYDSKSKVYQMKHAVDAAWRSIANECEDTVANCKFRWRVIQKSFARDYIKYGPKNKHYLKEYLEYLIPHVSAIDIPENVGRNSERNNTTQQEEEVEEYELEEAEDDEEEDREENADEELDDYENEGEEDPGTGGRHAEENDSDFSSADETVKGKLRGPLSHRRKHTSKFEDTNTHDEDGDAGDSQQGYSSAQGRRISRMRKATKRYLESGLCDSRKSENRQNEKRPRLSDDRKKSATNSPALEEPEKRRSIGNFPNRKVEVKLVKTKLNEFESKKSNVEQKEPTKKQDAESSDKFKISMPDKSRTVMVKVNKPTENSDSTAEKRYTLSFPDSMKKIENRSTQCNSDIPKTLDEQFLDTIKPQMELMNSRQKFNFKKRVYQALMDVFDDGTNFPNKDEVINMPSTGAPRFDTTSLGELRLMRELVLLVQAAKTTPEIMDATEKVATLGETSPSSKSEKNDRSLSLSTATPTPTERKSTTSNLVPLKNKDTLGLPRHILQKVVKVAGSNGGTILAHEGEKRRVYRIYPKGTLPPSVTNVATTNAASAASIGTFYVTPPKTTTASSNLLSTKVNTNNTMSASTVGTSSVNGKPLTYNGKIVSHLKSSTPMTSTTLNTSSVLMGRPRLSARPQPPGVGDEKRRSSQGSTGGNLGVIPALQNKNISSTNPQKLNPPTLTRAPKQQLQQLVSWDDIDKPASSPGLSQIQISQPISLNAAASTPNNVKTFLESGTDNDMPGDTSPNTILPDGGMTEEDDSGLLITGDNYDPLLLKSAVKDEPSE
ncbi:uncharacterized protein LOC142233649 [Haematobia irritans]|uniref:uncharacterized protein LOC142233649 n=1 Tax=Haematobia irritans TaxID=7368 RepID=UPI003F4F6765